MKRGLRKCQCLPGIASCSNVLEQEIIRAVAGLRVFKLNPIVIKGLACDYRHTVIILQVNIFFIHLRYALHGQSALAGGDRKPESSLQVFVYRLRCDFRSESRRQFPEKIVVVQNQRLPVQ